MIRGGDTVVNPVTGEALVTANHHSDVPGALLDRALDFRPTYTPAGRNPGNRVVGLVT